MKTFRFLDFPVYEDAKILCQDIIALTKTFSREYSSLADQMRRCALSIVLNIAEGSAKKSDKDFRRFLENSLGSVSELVACLDICASQALISNEQFTIFQNTSEHIARQLGGLAKKLNDEH